VNTTQNNNEIPSSLQRARIAARVILDNKGEDVRILDLREITQAFDFFVIGSGTSRRQLHSVSDEIDDVFEKKLGDKRRSVAGYQESRWVVLDYGDVVVHLFEPETREFYALEDLWGKGKEVAVDPKEEAVPTPEKKEPAAPILDEINGRDDYEDDEEVKNVAEEQAKEGGEQ